MIQGAGCSVEEPRVSSWRMMLGDALGMII
jgi:hypothetical protein